MVTLATPARPPADDQPLALEQLPSDLLAGGLDAGAAERVRRRLDHALAAKRMARVGSWTYDIATDRVSWSASSPRVVGHPDRTLPGTFGACLRTLRCPRRAQVQATIEEAWKDGTDFDLEWEVVEPFLPPLWLTVRGEPVRNVAGQVIGLRGIIQNMSKRKAAEEALAKSRDRIRDLARYHERDREAQRKHIAREVHDEMGQVLTSLRLRIAMLHQRVGADSNLAGPVADMRELVDRAITGVRAIASNLRPAALDLGLSAALEWLADDFGKRTGIRCNVDVGEHATILDEDRATAIFRVVQESLTNITKHANATAVTVSIFDVDGKVHLLLQDNGRGFDPSRLSGDNGLGILGMRERVHGLGGTFQIDSAADEGTTITMEIPLRSQPAPTRRRRRAEARLA